MKKRYRLIRRGERGAKFYCFDTLTHKRTSLGTANDGEAAEIVRAKNQSLRQPALNLQIARAYLAGSDPEVARRTWQNVLDEIPRLKRASTRIRWETAIKDKAFDPLRSLTVLETRAEHFLAVLQNGSVSTNTFLRRIHHFALDMNWLPWPVLPPKCWPAVKFKEKRGITSDEHQAILAGEQNSEWQAYYQLLWHLGGSQTDIARLRAEDIDWTNRTIAYTRCKTGCLSVIRIGDLVAQILRSRPQTGFLLPMIAEWRQADRGKAFMRRCRLVGVSGVSLHCYRYAWAERAKQCGYPERFAQEALGHSSKAVHRAYAKRASMKIPALEEFEVKPSNGKIVELPLSLENGHPTAATVSIKAS